MGPPEVEAGQIMMKRVWRVLVASLVAVAVLAPVSGDAGATGRRSESDSVYRLYSAYLLREPDAPGLQFWSDQYLSCAQSLAQISQFFANSPEFTSRYGALNNQQFVELIYQNVLGRAGEPDGVTYWAGQLAAGVSRGQVMIGFTESAEFVARTGTSSPQPPLCVNPGVSDSVYRLYRAYLLREPEASGERYWTEQYTQCRSTLAQISGFFASSPEFQSRYGALSNDQFVALVYQNVLGRPGEPTGVAFWTSQLNAGALSRGAMMIGFSESAEYVAVTGTRSPVGTGCAVPQPPATPPTTTEPAPLYRNCDEVRRAGKAPIRVGDPGYSRDLDRDGDGVGCE